MLEVLNLVRHFNTKLPPLRPLISSSLHYSLSTSNLALASRKTSNPITIVSITPASSGAVPSCEALAFWFHFRDAYPYIVLTINPVHCTPLTFLLLFISIFLLPTIIYLYITGDAILKEPLLKEDLTEVSSGVGRGTCLNFQLRCMVR